ncbi:MAG: putative ABC exporter domain-containing protein [Lacunisphaera sp.]
MTSAFLYLQFTSLKNRVTERIRRLKQPKYLVGAIVGVGYFYFFFFRKVIGTSRHGSAHQHAIATAANLPAELGPYLTSFGALILFVIAAVAWIIPSARASLQFTEAEVSFLFPAPITRQRLINFKLLRSQFSILVSTFFLILVFRRMSFLEGNPLMHAIGWWVILSTLSLHFTAASFAREKLLSLGLHPNRRRALALGLLAVVICGSIWWLRSHVAPPTTADFSGPETIVHYFGNVLQSPPIGWILAPFALVIRPYFAADLMAFLTALAPALAVMALHYWWVMRADVSFEEASIDQARKQAERITAIRSGNWQGTRDRPKQSRPAPFPLAARGWVAMAFLWKNLIGLGPFFRIRTWLIFAGLIVGFHVWAQTTALDHKIYVAISVVSLAGGAWLLVMGPMFMRHNVRLMVTHFDLLKGYPLRGWQVLSGSLISPIVILAAIEWLILLLGAPGVGMSGRGAALASGIIGFGSLGIALILPPLTGLMLSIPFAATLYFPAWIDNSAARGGGIEVMGQRLIFFAGYFVVLLVALLPAVLCGALAAFIANWLVGTASAVFVSTVVGSIILGAEFGAMVWWLGERFEHFDLSSEFPR